MRTLKLFIILLSLFFPILVSACSKKKSKNISVTAKDSISDKLNKTISYFQHIGEHKLENDVQILLPYLEKRFNFKVFDKKYQNVKEKLSLLYRNIWIYEPGDDWDNLSASQKDSTKKILENEYKKFSIDALTLYACLCDKIELPADFFDVLNQKIGMNGYELTHAALQFKNLQIKECINNQTYEMNQTQISKKIAENILFSNPAYNSVYDLKIEAAVILFYLQSSIINTDSMSSVFSVLLKYQDESGGWKRGPDNQVSQHTSLLALWLLLEMNQIK